MSKGWGKPIRALPSPASRLSNSVSSHVAFETGSYDTCNNMSNTAKFKWFFLNIIKCPLIYQNVCIFKKKNNTPPPPAPPPPFPPTSPTPPPVIVSELQHRWVVSYWAISVPYVLVLSPKRRIASLTLTHNFSLATDNRHARQLFTVLAYYYYYYTMLLPSLTMIGIGTVL